MKVVYPVIISKGDMFYIASVPDLEIDTQGVDLAEAIDMVRDAIGVWLCCEQDCGRTIPKASDISSVDSNQNDIITLIDVDVEAYRRKLENRTVRKNLTIPSWLNDMAEKEDINFSQVLQNALKEKLRLEV